MAVSKLKEVYVLHHVHNLGQDKEDVKLLGVFSSEMKALKSIEIYKQIKGFKNCPDGFSVDKYILDKTEWNEGFITIK